MEYYENGGGAVARLALHRGRRSRPPRPPTTPSTGTRPTPRSRRPSRPAPPTSSATTRRSTSTGARAHRAPGSPRTASSRAGRRPWCSRPASTGSPAAATTASAPTSTTCRSSTHWTFGNADFSVDKVVLGGPHELRVEYFEGGGGARAEFTYERIGDVVPDGRRLCRRVLRQPQPVGHARADPHGRRRRLRLGRRRPRRRRARRQLLGPVDQVRWTWPRHAHYKFTVTATTASGCSSTGRRCSTSGSPRADHVHRHPAADRGHAPDRARVLRGGRRRGREAELRANRRAAPPPPPPPEPFAAEYFDNRTLSGAPVLTRTDNAIDFDWGEGAPDSAIPADRFSARWTRTKTYAAGTYRFSVTGDDGIRVLVDGTQVVNGWFYQAPTTYTRRRPLAAGPAHRRRRVLRVHRRRGRQVQRGEARRPVPVGPHCSAGRCATHNHLQVRRSKCRALRSGYRRQRTYVR